MFKNLKKLKHDVSKVQSEASTSYSGTTELINAECGLEKYNSFLVDTFARNFVELGGDLKNSRVLDFGAGLGTLADLWNEKFNQRPVCVEIDQNHNKILKNRGYETYTKLDLNPNKIDLIYTSNVLEHIDDDVTVLRELAKSLESNGMIVIYVPAIQFLYSDMDRLVGHFRRYSKSELLSKVKSAGLTTLKVEYVDSMGIFASLAVRILGFNNGMKLGSAKSFELYDRILFPISRVFDKIGFSRLFGKNLLLICRPTT